MFRNDSQRGFSFVELLIALAIIGLLSSVVLVNYLEGLKEARDELRRTHLAQIQTALQLYYEANGQYPKACSSGSGWSGKNLGSGSAYECDDPSDDYIMGLVPTYIKYLPTDPGGPQEGAIEREFGYLYSVVSPGFQDYKLLAYGTVETEVVTGDHKFARYPTSCGANEDANFFKSTYAVYSRGFECNY